jgi:hypothetical protein
MATKESKQDMNKTVNEERQPDEIKKTLKNLPHKGRTALGKEGVKASDKIPKRG